MAAGAAAEAAAGETTPEQQAAQQEQAAKMKAWRTSVSMDPFKKLRKTSNDAGVTIYAWKQLNQNMSDEEFEDIFNVAEALGCTHTTLELPTNPEALKRIGDFAMKKKIHAAYHTHAQGSDDRVRSGLRDIQRQHGERRLRALGLRRATSAYPTQFLEYHDRISSFHLKDRTKPEHCSLNLAWGRGETPIREILQLVRKNRWNIPASVELEYNIPRGLGRRQGSPEVRRVLPERADGEDVEH